MMALKWRVSGLLVLDRRNTKTKHHDHSNEQGNVLEIKQNFFLSFTFEIMHIEGRPNAIGPLPINEKFGLVLLSMKFLLKLIKKNYIITALSVE